MRRTPVIAFALVVLLTIVGIGACSPSGTGTPTATRGGTLRMAVVGLTNVDPAQADEPTEVAVAEMLYTPLVRLDPRTHDSRPGLASRWHVDATQTRFTFTLRAGVRFSDGSPVGADDVKATLDRIAAKATKSPLAPLLESVVGYPEAHDAGSAPGLSGVIAREPRTVDITLRAPFAVFPAALANPGLGVVEAKSVTSPGASLLGSGPFHNTGPHGSALRLARTSGARLRAVDLVPYRSVAEAESAFEAGHVDMVRLAREETPAGKRRALLHEAPYLATSFYALNVSNPKFADARFRQAIVRAVDAQKLADEAYPGRARVAQGVIPGGVPAGPADQCHNVCNHDPAASRKLLAEAFPTGQVPAVAIDYDDSPTQAALAKEVAAELVAVGIPAAPRPHVADQYSAFLVYGGPELFRLGWAGDFASADAFLSPLFVSGAPENVAHVSSPAADAALKSARGEAHPGRRQRSYREAAAAVLGTFAVAPVVQFETQLKATPSVRSVAVDSFGGFDATRVWLASS